MFAIPYLPLNPTTKPDSLYQFWDSRFYCRLG